MLSFDSVNVWINRLEKKKKNSGSVNIIAFFKTINPLSPIWRGFTPRFVNYKKGCTRLATASDKVYQLLAHGRWFSLCTPAASTTKTGRHDIAESGVKHQKSNQ